MVTMTEQAIDPLETLQKYRAAGQPGNVGGGRYPVKSRSEMREVARLLTMANPKVRTRLMKESENGTLPNAIFIELVRQGYGMPEQKVKVEETERQRPGLRTRNPIGWDPLTRTADVKVIEAIYERVPELPPHTPEAPPAEPESPRKKTLRSTIVPRPDVLPQPDPAPPGFKKRVPKRPPEDDGTAPLRVDGI